MRQSNPFNFRPNLRYTRRMLKHRFLALFRHKIFWALTLFGNSAIFIGSFILYNYELNHQYRPIDYFDCLLWSTGMITTVGTDLAPTTTAGKFTVLILMLLGTLFTWSYMAFFVTALIAPDLSHLEKEVHEIEKEIQQLKPE